MISLYILYIWVDRIPLLRLESRRLNDGRPDSSFD